MASHSTDGGATFAPPVIVGITSGVQEKGPGIAHGDRIYIAVVRHDVGSPTGTLVVYSSGDIGMTWQPEPFITPINNVGLFRRVDLVFQRRLEQNELVAVYTDQPSGSPQADLFRAKLFAGSSWLIDNLTNTPTLADRNPSVRIDGEIEIITIEAQHPATSQFTTQVLTSGDAGASFTGQWLPNPGGPASQTSLGLAGWSLVVRSHGSPATMHASSTNPLVHFHQVRMGGTGLPGNPSWFARGTLCNSPQAVLDLQSPGVIAVLGLSSGLQDPPLSLFGSAINLDLSTLVTDVVVSDSLGQAAITVPPGLAPGFEGYLQAMRLLPPNSVETSTALRVGS
jgi:hypothetical protein